MTIRKLLDQERQLLEFLVTHSDAANKEAVREWLEKCECETLSDGEMGSIRLINLERNGAQAKFARAAAEFQFTDKDGVTVLITLNVSGDGYPFEMDFWKVDFAPLVEYPKPENLKPLEKPR